MNAVALMLAGSLALAAAASAQQHERAKILPPDVDAGDWFGCAVAMSGRIAIIGARGDEDNGESSGSAYVFDVSDPEAPLQLAKIVPSDGEAGDKFGTAVGISGAVAIIGAPLDDDKAPYCGSAYLFDISDPANPVQISKLLPSDGDDEEFFGESVAIGPGLAVVASPFNWDIDFLAGKAYIFDISDPANPFETAVLFGHGWWCYFGAAAAVLGDAVLISEPGYGAGRVYLFDAGGQRLAEIIPHAGSSGDFFGGAIAASGSRLLVGAQGDAINGIGTGSAALYDITNPLSPKWRATFNQDDGATGDEFGGALAMDKSAAIIGAKGVDDGTGSCYAFDISDITKPVQRGELRASDGAPVDWFADALACHADTAVVGALFDDDNGESSGAAFVFYPAACLADLTHDGEVDLSDFILFRAAWLAGEPAADWDRDGALNTIDFLAYLNAWARGC